MHSSEPLYPTDDTLPSDKEIKPRLYKVVGLVYLLVSIPPFLVSLLTLFALPYLGSFDILILVIIGILVTLGYVVVHFLMVFKRVDRWLVILLSLLVGTFIIVAEILVVSVTGVLEYAEIFEIGSILFVLSGAFVIYMEAFLLVRNNELKIFMDERYMSEAHSMILRLVRTHSRSSSARDKT